MHDSLDLRNLSNINSTKTRGVANAVAAGSENDLDVLCELITTIPRAEAALFLPALFVNVDSARIPDPNTLDFLLSASSHIPSIYLGFKSIHAISHLAAMYLVPVAVSQDLWPRIWNWIDFLHSCWDSIPMMVQFCQEKVILVHSILILALDKDHETSKTMRSTPGVRRLAAAAWKSMVGGDPGPRDHATLSRIGGILSIVSDSSQVESNFDEVVDGVGGNITDLASTMVRHLSRAHINPNPASIYALVRGCLSFLRINSESRCRLKVALKSEGFTSTLITAIFKLHGIPAVGAMELCLLELTRALDSPSDIALAIEAGLLQLVITIAASMTATDKDANLRQIYLLIEQMLETQLRLPLLRYEVLSKLASSFEEILEFAERSTIHTSAFQGQWQDLHSSIRKPLTLFMSWAAQGKPSFTGCDNIACGKIGLKHNFKCCSNCQSATYCSEDCQSADWRAEHRGMCQRLRSARLETPQTLTTRGKSFLRALLTHDYQRLWVIIRVHQIFFIYEHPDEEFVTLFKYTDACQNVSVEVCGRRFLETQTWATKLGLELAFARAAGRRGRMELHIMTIFEGYAAKRILFPMRRETTQVHDVLVRVARRMPSGLTKAAALSHITLVVESSFAEVDLESLVCIH